MTNHDKCYDATETNDQREKPCLEKIDKFCLRK